VKTVQEIEKFNRQSPLEAYKWLCENEESLRDKYGGQVTQELFNHNEYYYNEAEKDAYLQAQELAFESRMDY
jgi:hypothetical protein